MEEGTFILAFMAVQKHSGPNLSLHEAATIMLGTLKLIHQIKNIFFLLGYNRIDYYQYFLLFHKANTLS